MKTEMKAVVASIVVIALALTAVSGITYSWFSASEEAQINVSTGAIKYDAVFTITDNNGADVPIGTDNTFSVAGFVPDNYVMIKANVTNESTINTVYRAYVEVLAASPTLDEAYLNQFTINGEVFSAYGDKIVAKDWASVAAKTDFVIPEFQLLFKNDTSMSSAESAALMGKTIVFKVVVEGYQSDYPTTSFDPSGTTKVPVNGAISGTVTSTGTAEDIPVSIALPASTAGKDLALSIAKDTTGTTPKYTIGASLTTTSTFTEPVKMTITVDGDYSAGNVIYLGTTDEQPTIISAVYSGGKTTITFTTTHFSEFMIANDVVAVADTVEGAKAFTTLYDAFQAAMACDKSKVANIILVKDCSGQGISVKSGSNIAVDFNGFTYTVNEKPFAGSKGTETQCFQLLKDSTIVFKNGSIVADETGITVSDGNHLEIIIQNYSNLTLDNMTLDATKGFNWVNYTLSNNNGTIIIDNTEIIAKAGRFAFDVCGFSTNANYPSVDVTVTGDSSIRGTIELSSNDNEHALSLKLESGTFTKITDGGNGDKVNVTKSDGIVIEIPDNYKWEDNKLVKA